MEKLYHIRNRDEDYENNPFFIADSPEEALKQAFSDDITKEYISEHFIEDGDIFITEIDLYSREVRYMYWNGHVWEVDTTNTISESNNKKTIEGSL